MRGGVVGWGTALQAGKEAGSLSDSGIAFHLHNPSDQTITQPIKRNKYHEYFLARKGGRCVGLINVPPSRTDCHEIWEPQPSGTVKACPGLYEVVLLLPLPNIKHCYIFCMQNISLRTLYSVSSTVIPPFIVTECITHNSNKIPNAGKENIFK
jgi:hypothetical protein